MRARDLEAARLNRGMSREQLASAIGVTPRVIRYVEEGGRPRPWNAKKIADFFGSSVTDLWPLEERTAA